MGEVGSQIFDIGLCPSPGQRMGKSWRAPVARLEEYNEETNHLTVTLLLVPESVQVPDRIYDIFLCPEGVVCGCSYEAVVGWEIIDSCGAKLYWVWPRDAG